MGCPAVGRLFTISHVVGSEWKGVLKLRILKFQRHCPFSCHFHLFFILVLIV
jgi:hypothetical protein